MHHHVHQAVAQALQAPQGLVTFLKLAALAPEFQVVATRASTSAM